MDSGRQLIRWALPGWIAYIFWTLFILINTFLYGQNQVMYLDILTRMKNLLIPLGVASIPLGFIFYQLYYWGYWYVAIPSLAKRKFIDPVDRGQQILSSVRGKVNFNLIFNNSLIDTPESAFKKWKGVIYIKSIEVMQMYRNNWHLSDSVWYFALSDEKYKNTAEFLEKRNQMLSDIYHSLGACYAALISAYLFYLLAFGYISFIEMKNFFASNTGLFSIEIALIILKAIILRIISVIINTFGFFLAFYMFKGSRDASFSALLALKHDVITNVLLNNHDAKKNTPTYE